MVLFTTPTLRIIIELQFPPEGSRSARKSQPSRVQNLNVAATLRKNRKKLHTTVFFKCTRMIIKANKHASEQNIADIIIILVDHQ